ncbi:AT rich interactive domain 3B [Chamberlinius hualienensis]
MDNNESDVDGSLSNPEEDEELNESDIESELDGDGGGGGGVGDGGGGGRGRGGGTIKNRVRVEDGDAEVLARLKEQELEEREDVERELKAHNLLPREVHRPRDPHLGPSYHYHSLLHHHHSLRGGSVGGGNGTAEGLRTTSPASTGVGASGQILNYSSPPTMPSSMASSPPSNASPGSTTQPQGTDTPQNWSFEEQFKQDPAESKVGRPGDHANFAHLYELSDDVKRKEFLDDLFCFMQKRGTPVNRIPIMAKQVLDLYELYNLVTARGGLVEVINKKIWREITKGLNLPSSITSAAFTLRTQYMKYLYPYECEKKKLSTPAELQAAIDGNRREGRRSSYSTYADMVSRGSGINSQMSPLSLVTNRQVNGNGTSHGVSSGEEDSFSSTPSHPMILNQREALNLEVMPRNDHSSSNRPLELAARKMLSDDGPPSKRMLTDDDHRHMSHATLPSAHLKITSRGDGRSGVDNSLVVSMEINGIMYQGVLFAQSRGRMA